MNMHRVQYIITIEKIGVVIPISGSVRKRDDESSAVTSSRMSFCGWFSGEKFRDHFEKGIYVCSNCGNELFHSQTKYEHSSPWPAFTRLIREDSVARVKESSTAIKISCSKCGNGLGHEFLGDGPKKGMNRY